VLVNRAHGSADLALPIGEAEDGVFSAIDGRRTVNEIARAAPDERGRQHALRFIERLWRHDHIVFDASA
jgi:hypothetical protein